MRPSLRLVWSVLALAAVLPAAAQATVASDTHSWSSVQALPAGTSVYVKARSSKFTCQIASVATDTLTCENKNTRSTTNYRRVDILNIKRKHRLRSAAIGAAIGGAAGAITGASVVNDSGSFVLFTKKDGALVLAVPGILIGGLIGFFVDFTRSTVYRS